MASVEQGKCINGKPCTPEQEARIGAQLRRELEDYKTATKEGRLPGSTLILKPGIRPSTEVRPH